MNLLRDNELIFGRLLKIEEPHLIARYNKALEAFGLKPTKLESFEIDRTGFSPQIAEALKDEQYLDPNGVNRRFIILTPAQIELPVVHTAFSDTSQLVYEFMSKNARAINAITIKDVVYGEIEEQVSEVRDIEDLLSIVQVEFKVLSAEDLLGKAAELGRLADRVKHEPDTWRDDELLNRMVALARDTGDIRENSLVPEQVVFRHDAYWTSHFGGVYIFADRDTTTVIADPATPGFRRSRPWQVSYLPKDDPARIFRFLAETGRIQLPRASWIEGSGYLIRPGRDGADRPCPPGQSRPGFLPHGPGLAADLDAPQRRSGDARRRVSLPQRGGARDRPARPVENGGDRATPALPRHARRAGASRRLADQPADLRFRAVRFHRPLRVQQAGLLSRLRGLFGGLARICCGTAQNRLSQG